VPFDVVELSAEASAAAVDRVNLHSDAAAINNESTAAAVAPHIPTVHTAAAQLQPNHLRPATAADYSFVVDLQNKFAWALGFLPHVALRAYVDMGGVTIATDNDQHAGYLLGRQRLRCAPHVRPIYQAAVCMDAQRRHLGLELVERTAAAAAAAGQTIVQCWCRTDLDANQFWAAAGFTSIAIRRPDTWRGLPLILWRRPLTAAAATQLLHLPRAAGYRASTSTPTRLLTAADRSAFLRPSTLQLASPV
jgi:N-acetylglutamate synthase-like GNAT family acetyltransferase